VGSVRGGEGCLLGQAEAFPTKSAEMSLGAADTSVRATSEVKRTSIAVHWYLL
jgi:hypothetical protein